MPQRSTTRSGFTLTEILVATALMGFLAAMTWSLFDTYRNLFESGIDRSGQVRIARALTEQITDDLRSAIQESTAKRTVSLETSEESTSAFSGEATQNLSHATGLTNETATSQTATESGNEEENLPTTRRFGLFGSSRTLRFDVLQVDPRHVYRLASQATLAEDENVGSLLFGDTVEGTLDNETSICKAAELRTIEYTFTPRESDEINAQVPEEDPLTESSLDDDDSTFEQPKRPGLLRRELSFDMKLDDQDGSLLDDIGVEMPDPDDTFDPTECYLPEVIDLQFRYYDGNGWTTSWDSLARRSLPVAVEITFQLETARRKRRLGEQSTSTETEVAENATVGADVETDEVTYIDETYKDYQDSTTSPPQNQYQILVTLPTSAKHPGVQAETDTTFETPEPLMQRTLETPTLETPKLKTDLKKKDKWIRE